MKQYLKSSSLLLIVVMAIVVLGGTGCRYIGVAGCRPRAMRRQ